MVLKMNHSPRLSPDWVGLWEVFPTPKILWNPDFLFCDQGSQTNPTVPEDLPLGFVFALYQCLLRMCISDVSGPPSLRGRTLRHNSPRDCPGKISTQSKSRFSSIREFPLLYNKTIASLPQVRVCAFPLRFFSTSWVHCLISRRRSMTVGTLTPQSTNSFRTQGTAQT